MCAGIVGVKVSDGDTEERWRGCRVRREGSLSGFPAPAQCGAKPVLEPNSQERRSRGDPGRASPRRSLRTRSRRVRWAGCREREGRASRPMSAEIVWGRTRAAARRAAVGRGRLRRAQHGAPPTSVCGWAGGLHPDHGGGFSSGKRRAGTGTGARGARAGWRPSGKPGPESWGDAALLRSRWRPSQGAPPQGHQASAGRVAGLAGPSLPPSPGLRCAHVPAGPIRRVTTRKRGSGARPLACFLTPARGGRPLPGWDAGCRCSSPAWRA